MTNTKKLTTKRLGTNLLIPCYTVCGLVENVEISKTGPSYEPWHLRINGEGWAQESTKRACLEGVEALVARGDLHLKG